MNRPQKDINARGLPNGFGEQSQKDINARGLPNGFR
jgi:hypothetical protein